MIFHVQTLEIVIQSQDYVNVLVEGGDLLAVVILHIFQIFSSFSMQNKHLNVMPVVDFLFISFLGLCDLMQPTQVEIQECCSKTNLCSFEQGRCDPANRNADCQGNLICKTNTDICGKYYNEMA